jgi:hypothetical protein
MNVEINILNKKLELIQWLSTVEDSTILEKIMELRKGESKDWWNTISDAEKQSIEQGIKDADAGKLSKHSNARKLYDKWL